MNGWKKYKKKKKKMFIFCRPARQLTHRKSRSLSTENGNILFSGDRRNGLSRSLLSHQRWRFLFLCLHFVFFFSFNILFNICVAQFTCKCIYMAKEAAAATLELCHAFQNVWTAHWADYTSQSHQDIANYRKFN